jgi:hypothetical protein
MRNFGNEGKLMGDVRDEHGEEEYEGKLILRGLLERMGHASGMGALAASREALWL